MTPATDMRKAAPEGDFAATDSPERYSPPPVLVPASMEQEKENPDTMTGSSLEQPSIAEPGARGPAGMAPVVPPVIPLVHAPDDPGPDPEAPAEPVQEPPPELPPDGWSRLRSMFKP